MKILQNIWPLVFGPVGCTAQAQANFLNWTRLRARLKLNVLTVFAILMMTGASMAEKGNCPGITAPVPKIFLNDKKVKDFIQAEIVSRAKSGSVDFECLVEDFEAIDDQASVVRFPNQRVRDFKQGVRIDETGEIFRFTLLSDPVTRMLSSVPGGAQGKFTAIVLVLKDGRIRISEVGNTTATSVWLDLKKM